MGEKTKNLLSNLSKRRINGLNPHSQRQSDLEQAHNNGNNFVYYIDPQVSTTQTKKATKNREEIISSVKKRFNNIILKSEEVQEDK